MTSLENLRRRSHILSDIRKFFEELRYIEVQTPQLAATPIPEAHIELFETAYLPPDYRCGTPVPLYLLPSPEYYLKQLLAAGSGSIYEIAHSFRNAESIGPQHNPEFTMLEYYTVDADGDDSLEITRELLTELGIAEEPLVISMEDAFSRYAGIDLAALLEGASTEPDGSIMDSRTVEERFQHIFLTRVEPELPTDRPVFVTRYPAVVPTLARNIAGTPWADRWELYLGGMEVANCFGEETDPERIGEFFCRQAAEKGANCRVQHPVDMSFPGAAGATKAGAARLPRCSGVAMGVDRLVMYLLGEKEIGRVLTFPLFR
jgi:elongation factor P--(R)-beta-lysine ligase